MLLYRINPVKRKLAVDSKVIRKLPVFALASCFVSCLKTSGVRNEGDSGGWVGESGILTGEIDTFGSAGRRMMNVRRGFWENKNTLLKHD